MNVATAVAARDGAVSPARMRGGVRVVHDGRRRLRARAPALGLTALDTDHLTRLLRATPGVGAVRLNPGAISAIFEYDGAPDTRALILERLATLRRDQLRFRARNDAAEGVTVELLDVLAVGIGALRGQFSTAVATDLMMSTGEFLEETTMRQSGALLQELLTPNPEFAWIDGESGAVEVPFARVRRGDVVIVHTGDLVPVDGVVIDGVAELNQASITVESVPVSKRPGDSMIAGSVAQSGRIKIEARQVGDETTTARIAALIRESLSAPSETERLAEKHADGQVYMTLGLRAATLALTRDLRRLSSVFLVDYACPIKLSARVAVRAAMSEAVGRGVLIKGGPSIEKLSAVDAFVFDKTGTLTHGALAVTDVLSLNAQRWPKATLLARVGSIAEHSQHPVAQALAEAARAAEAGHVAHGDVSVEVGRGLRADGSGGEVLIGSRHFLETVEGVDFTKHAAQAEGLVAAGKMVLYVAIGGAPAGLIGLRDALREDARETADRLRAAGVRHLVMLTGDRRSRAAAFGAALGFDEIHAELRPEDKARILAELQAAGRKVAFVGDGVNDAPALTAANVGFSMSRGADVAQATADILLLDDRIGAVADARELSDQAMRIIGSNTTAALIINTALFASASVGWLSPVAAAVAHNGSTLGLLLYALSRTGSPRRDRREPAPR